MNNTRTPLLFNDSQSVKSSNWLNKEFRLRIVGAFAAVCRINEDKPGTNPQFQLRINRKPARNEIRFSLNGIILLRSENALHLESRPEAHS